MLRARPSTAPNPRRRFGYRRPRPAAVPEPLRAHFVIWTDWKEVKQEDVMGRGLLLWLLGIPIPIIILIWVLGGLHG
jgi:hypothetical protein